MPPQGTADAALIWLNQFVGLSATAGVGWGLGTFQPSQITSEALWIEETWATSSVGLL